MAINKKPAPTEKARGSVPTQPGAAVQAAQVGGIGATGGQASQFTSNPNPVTRGPSIGGQQSLDGNRDPLNIQGAQPSGEGRVEPPMQPTPNDNPTAPRPQGRGGAPSRGGA
jgi:hypothetical protein